MMKSNFKKDLGDEKILGNYLDTIYSKIFNAEEFILTRVWDSERQNSGIDLIIHHLTSSQTFNVDEKAQLDYINLELPTFTFETSYLRNGKLKQGWLFDDSKKTNYYFLVTSILCKGPRISSGIESVKIHSIDRLKLKQLLTDKGLTKSVIGRYDSEIRNRGKSGAIRIKELHHIDEGRFYFSKDNKAERPINLVMKLSFLVRAGVAKVIHEP